jgi:hypothetical protein
MHCTVSCTAQTNVNNALHCLLLCEEAVGIDPSAAAAATPKPTAETIDSNQLASEEGKNTPDVFVRKETVSYTLQQQLLLLLLAEFVHARHSFCRELGLYSPGHALLHCDCVLHCPDPTGVVPVIMV